MLLVPELFGLGAPAGGVGLALVAQVLHALGRFQVGRMRAAARDHLGQIFGIFQHRAGAQVVVVERLALAVLLKKRLLETFEEALFADIRAGIVDKHAGLDVTRGVDVAVELAAGLFLLWE